MAYAVRITTRAELDLEAIYDSLRADHSDAAHEWYVKLHKAILSLETNPSRCPTTPETKTLRHLLYGAKPHVYRVIFRILEKQKAVEILHIRHGARDRFEETGI